MKGLEDKIERYGYSIDEIDWEIEHEVFHEKLQHNTFPLEIHLVYYHEEYQIMLYDYAFDEDDNELGRMTEIRTWDTEERAVEYIMEELVHKTGLGDVSDERLRAEMEARGIGY